MQINNNNQNNFGMQIKPTQHLNNLRKNWSERSNYLFELMSKRAIQINPNADAHIDMKESKNLYGPKRCIVDILIPDKRAKEPILESFTVSGAPEGENAVEWFVKNPKFLDVMNAKLQNLRETFYNLTKSL